MYGRPGSLEPGENLVHRGLEKEEATCMTTSCMQSKKRNSRWAVWDGPEHMPKASGPIRLNSKGQPCLDCSDSNLGLLGCPVSPRLWA